MREHSSKGSLNHRLREAREAYRWSQQEVADQIGTTPNTVSRWELGQTIPGPYFRAKLCALFGKSVEELGLVAPQSPLASQSVLQRQEVTPATPPERAVPCSDQDDETVLADGADGIGGVTLDEVPASPASVARATWPATWTIPYPRNPFFLGRDEELVQIRHCLQTGQAMALSQPQAISGLGGIGKTQLALEYAYRYAQEYQAVLWARAESTEALIASYVAFAALLQLPVVGVKEQAVTVQAVTRWLSTHRGWLLILDNADELSILPDFLPLPLGGHVLITTRAGATGRLARRVEIEVLSPTLSALLLLRRCGRLAPDAELSQALPEEQTRAMQLAEELGGLPLALDQAGAYLEETGTALAAYSQLYQQHRAELLAQRRGGFVTDHPLPVAATWSVSFQRIAARNPAAAELLKVLAWLPADAIAEEILTEGAAFLGPVLAPIAENALLLNQAMEALRASSLLRRDPRARMLSLHRLVQAVLQDQQTEGECQTWTERVVRAVNRAFPNVHDKTLAQCERLLPLALSAAAHIEHHQMTCEDAGQLLFKTALYLLHRGRYREAEPLYQRTLHIQKQSLGPEHPDVAHSLYHLANLYSEQSKYREAEELYLQALHVLQALHIWETQQLGSEHHLVADVLNGLGLLYSRQRRYEEAEPRYQQALRLYEQQLGSEHPLTAHVLHNLALLYLEQGKYQQAEPLHQQVLRIQEQQVGAMHSLVAFPLSSLAWLFYEQGKYEQAELFSQRALHIWEQSLGSEHPYTAHVLNILAFVYLEQGRYEETESLFQQAMRILEQRLGSEHSRVAESLNGLANLYARQGKDEEAEALYRQVLSILEQRLGPEHPRVAHQLNGLAKLYAKQGKGGEAEALFQEALHILEQQVGPEHPRVAYQLNGLANLYARQGKDEEAEALYRQALSILEQRLGPEHPDTAETLHDFATLREHQGNHQEALTIYQRALAIREQALGSVHPTTAQTRTCLLALLQRIGQHEQAAMLEAVQPGTSKPEHEQTRTQEP